MMGTTIIVSRMRKSVKKLRTDTEKAQINEQKKTAFFDSINKKIQEPINTIIDLNHQLNDNDTKFISDEERTKNVMKLDHKTEYLTHLINDVLLISKIESGTYKKKSEKCDIHQLCSKSIESFKSKNHITLITDGRIQTFVSDVDLMKMMLEDLLSFAVDNAPSDSQVNLFTSTEFHQITLRITYAGTPFSAAEAETMFDIDGIKTDGKGNILLYKAKKIAQLLNNYLYTDITYKDGIEMVIAIPI